MRKSKRNRWIYTILMLLCVVGFWWFENFYTPDPYASENPADKTEFPDNFLPDFPEAEVVVHNHHVLGYSEPYEQAAWVAYTLKPAHLTRDDRQRPYFVEDPRVRTKSADWRNYRGSGYDRGHLCPAGDRRFSEEAYNHTFYTSNISPQDSEFNAGTWNTLEQQVRAWCRRYGELYVITGGVLEPGLEEIGSEAVDVPRYFYKVVFRGEAAKLKATAFLMPNREENLPLDNYRVSIDVIEAATGIDFFAELDPRIQQQWEAEATTSSWPLTLGRN